MFFPPISRGSLWVKFSTVYTTLCLPSSRSVCPTQNTQNTNNNESNKFVSEGKPLSAERGNPSEPPHVASSVPTRWRHCITNNSVGLKTQLCSVPSGDTRESRSGLANRFGSRVGYAYNNAGLQIAIRSKTLSFQRHSLFSHGRESFSHSGRGKFISLKQGSDSGGTPQSDEPGFLFPVFSGSKERRLSPPYLGPSSVEQTFEEIHLQNADTGRSRPCHKTERLVHISRSERCFLSHKHLSSAQEFSSFCLPGHMLRIHSSSVWTQFESPVFLSVRGGGLNASENNRSENPDLHRRLAHHSRIEGEGVAGHRPCARAHHIARVPSERGQEQSHAQSECQFPGFGVELGCHASASLSRARSLSMSCLSQFREGAKVQYRTCLRMQGLMASSTQVVPLGLLKMRAFMKWVLSLHFSPIRDLCRSVTVTRARALQPCAIGRTQTFTHGEPLSGRLRCGKW